MQADRVDTDVRTLGEFRDLLQAERASRVRAVGEQHYRSGLEPRGLNVRDALRHSVVQMGAEGKARRAGERAPDIRLGARKWKQKLWRGVERQQPEALVDVAPRGERTSGLHRAPDRRAVHALTAVDHKQGAE